MKSTNELGRCLRAIDEFRREVAETSPDDLDCRALERTLRERLEAVGCEVMREILERADTKAPRITVNGKEGGNRRESKGTYVTTFGQIALPRSIYSQAGGGPVAVALDLRLGIHEGRYTPQMARALNRAVALMPDEDSEGSLAELGTAMVSKSTLHRVPRVIGARYESRRAQIQEELRESDEAPDAAVTVQASLDGVMVPQDGEYAGARGRRTETPHSPRHEARYALPPAPGPAANDSTLGRSWHEASVGTVSFWDKDCKHLKTIYLAASWREQVKELEDGAERVLEEMRYYRDRESGLLGPLVDLERAIELLAKQAAKGRMEYAAARAANRPIGTGVVEAAAKTVVNTRMKRSGARFSQRGGQTVMIFRTALLSGRFDKLSECLTASYTAVVKAA